MITFGDFSDFSNSLRNKNLLWQDLSEIKLIKGFDLQLSRFDSAVINNEYLRELLNDNPVHLAFYGQNAILIAFNLKERADEKIIRDHLNNFITGKSFTYELKDGIICISNNHLLLQNAFDVNRAKLVNNIHFRKLESETNYNGTRVFLNFNQDLMPSLSMAALSLKPENISLNGIALNDSLKFYGDAEAPTLSDFSMLRNIPLLCNEFELAGIKTIHIDRSKWWQKINEEALFNASKQFSECTGTYLLIPRLPSGDKSLVLEITDTARFREIFPFLCDTGFMSAAIKKIKTGGSFIASTFPFLQAFETNYFLLQNGHLIATKTEGDAQIFLNAALNSTSIMDNTDFAAYASKNFDPGIHYLSYKAVNSLQKSAVPLSGYISEEEKDHLKNVSHYSLSGFFKNKNFNFRLNLKYFQENVSAEPNVLWTMNTGLPPITRPFAFINHLTKAKEIVYQLEDKSVVLQSATGKIIWTKAINEEIRSEIFTVDAFKNGKNQILFNSDNYLHLIDRNGNYVQGYPVKLPAKATNSLTMFDYEKKRDYRLFIACADNKIYNYSIWGIKQEGFKTFAVAAKVVLPLRYCKVGLSDYLVTADVKGRIYAFSRKGEGRIDFKNKLLENASDFEIECGNNLSNTQIMYYDDKNFLLNKISLSDKKEVFKTNETSDESSTVFTDFDKNSTIDFILIDKTTYQVYDASGLKIAEESLQSELNSEEASFFQNDSRSIITMLDRRNKKLRIRNAEQKTEKVFSGMQLPLITDLFNDGKLYAVVIDDKLIRCVKL